MGPLGMSAHASANDMPCVSTPRTWMRSRDDTRSCGETSRRGATSSNSFRRTCDAAWSVARPTSNVTRDEWLEGAYCVPSVSPQCM